MWNKDFPVGAVLDKLNATYTHHPMDELTQHNPFKVLTACILSLRTKDETTMPAAERLFAVADTPQTLAALPPETVEKLIFPVGFYKTKAQTLVGLSQDLLDRFHGQVPQTIKELLTLKGVGRKTANLVVGLGHQLPAICVDVHVHRICQRFGLLSSPDPDTTEMILREHLPLPYWRIINKVLVLHGQQVCKPVSPWCDVCPVATDCQRVDVKPRKLPKKN
jgi:endonuclease-3